MAGLNTYLDIAVPYRHGKSDLVSRSFPAYFLGRCAHLDPDVMMTGYGASLVRGFSQEAKAIIRSERYAELFPNLRIARGRDTNAEWAIEGSSGSTLWAGLGGSLVGKGAGLLAIDDFCKSKAEARSEAYREKTWEAVSDALTRLAPVHIVVICATSWHEDDARGRLHKHMAEDENWPQFDILKFPARNPDGSFLFPERFTDEWYKLAYATQQRWAAPLLDCDPAPLGGGRFDVASIDYAPLAQFPARRYIRAWDLASSKKERNKPEPDFTVGMLGTITGPNKKTPSRDPYEPKHLWVKDAIYGRWEAPERNRKILATTKRDGSRVPIYVEAFGAYKDSFSILRNLLTGVRTVRKSMLPGDKSAKLADLEPVFDAGNVHLPEQARGQPWVDEFIKHFRAFPDGAHDDFCDAASIIYHESQPGQTSVATPA